MTSATNHDKDAALGYLLLRVTIGTNIFIHGLSRILAGPSRFADALVPAFQHTPLPPGFVRLFALVYLGLKASLACLCWLESEHDLHS
jgi:thiosulfate dehydrogenase [quinone] large subunit